MSYKFNATTLINILAAVSFIGRGRRYLKKTHDVPHVTDNFTTEIYTSTQTVMDSVLIGENQATIRIMDRMAQLVAGTDCTTTGTQKNPATI